MSNSKLKQEDVRRIERILQDADRPNVPPIGTNHADDADQWNVDSIYRGELIINESTGELMTRDSRQPIHLSKEDGILSGLEISTSGVSLREINVSAGKVRIDGRVYKYDGTVDIDDATITVPENIETFSRLDAIAVKKDMEVFDTSDDFYGVDFRVFRGTSASNIPVPNIEEDYIFLGFVLVKPNQTAQDVLRPLSVKKIYDDNLPVNVTPEQFASDLKSRVFRWEQNSLFLQNQILEYDSNLYKAAYTHVSGEDILGDIDNAKLLALGNVAGSNITRISHVGGTPSSNSWENGFFSDWNANTRIADVFWDVSEWAKSFAPAKPANISLANLYVTSANAKGGIATSVYDVANVANVVVSDSSNVNVEVESRFTPFDSGALKSYLYTPATSYSTTNLDLTSVPDLPNITQLISGSNVYTFTVLRGDNYTEQGYKGFYNSINANVKTQGNLTPNTSSYRFNFTHLSSTANTETEFYVESVRSPEISNVINFGATSRGNLKYLSGIPILKEGDSVDFDFDAANIVRYFYHYDYIANVSSEIMESDKVIDFSNVEILDASNRPPFAELTDANADGPVVSFANVECNVTANVIESVPQFTIRAFNALGDYDEETTSGNTYPVDDVTEEANVRLWSGDGDFPSGAANTDWGNVYTDVTSSANIMLNSELQLFGGTYFYPKQDYTANVGVTFDGNVVSYPNYSNDSNAYRWATFSLGNITDQKYFNIYVREASGFDYDLSDGVTVSPNVKIYLRVWNTTNTAAATGWLDLNKAYNSSLEPNPEDDGDPALDLSWMEGNPDYRRASFGTVERTGNVYVRVGLNAKTPSFKDVVEANVVPEISDASWSEYNLGNITGESYVVVSINGTSNTLKADFLNGTTMTSRFDAQLRVRNDDDSSKATDWIDINEAYPANGFEPSDYNDPALDLTYYSGGTQDPTVRKVTFGPTTRTGNVTVRLRDTGIYTYSNVTMIYPEDC